MEPLTLHSLALLGLAGLVFPVGLDAPLDVPTLSLAAPGS